MKTKVFGYCKGKESDLLELKEITFFINSDQAMALGLFFSQCGEEMRSDPSWEHKHFSEDTEAGVVIYNAVQSCQS